MKKIVLVFITIFAFILCYPVVFLLVGSFMGDSELHNYLKPLLANESGTISWSLLPLEPTGKFYIKLLMDTPEFFVMFWNSVKLTLAVLVGQLLIAVPAAWGFARYRFFLRNFLFILYVVLMTMPFVVVMLPQYLVLDKLSLLDTLWAIIFPGIFSTFPIFIMVHFFRSIPESIIESARIDGASEISVFLFIGIPLGSSGIMTAMVLGFLEYWNILEQPFLFLKNKTLWPLSLFMPNILLDQIGVSFVAAIVTLVPALLVFIAGQSYLEQGVVATSINE